jgi:hypothetical protein
MVTTSSDRGFSIPTVASDNNLWGGELNTTIAGLDTILGGSLTLYSSNGFSQQLLSSQSQIGRVVIPSTGTGNFSLLFSSSLFALGNYEIWHNGVGTGGIQCLSSYSSGVSCLVPQNSLRMINSDGVNVQFADSQVGNVQGGGLVNKFRNPNMDVAQRALPITGTPAGVYTLDGWVVSAATGSPSVLQVYSSHINGNALRISNSGGAMSVLTLSQRIESVVAAELLAATAPQAVTVQFAIYNNTGASITPQLQTSYPNAVDNWAASIVDLAAVNFQACPNGTLTTIAYSFTPSASMTNGYQIALLFGSAMTGITGTIDVSIADIRATPGSSPGIVSSPPTPELRPVYTEVLFCQRYFFGPPVGFGYLQFTNQAGSAAINSSYVEFPAAMRAVPVLSGFTSTHTNITVTQPAAGQTAASWVFDCSVSASSTGTFYMTAGSWSAEL